MLTDKEIQVLKLKARGMTQVMIAKRMQISQPAVSHFVKNALGKIEDAKSTIKNAKGLGFR